MDDPSYKPDCEEIDGIAERIWEPRTVFQHSERPDQAANIGLDMALVPRVSVSRETVICGDDNFTKHSYGYVEEGSFDEGYDDKFYLDLWENKSITFKQLILHRVDARRLLPHMHYRDTARQRICSVSKRSRKSGVAYILDDLMDQRNVSLWKTFFNALIMCGHGYIVENIRSLEAVDKTYQQSYLRTLIPLFLGHLEIRDTLGILLQTGVIAQSVKCKVEVLLPRETSAWQRLIDNLTNITPDWYCHFIKIVEEIESARGPTHIVNNYSILELLKLPDLSCGLTCRHVSDAVLSETSACDVYTSYLEPVTSRDDADETMVKQPSINEQGNSTDIDVYSEACHDILERECRFSDTGSDGREVETGCIQWLSRTEPTNPSPARVQVECRLEMRRSRGDDQHESFSSTRSSEFYTDVTGFGKSGSESLEGRRRVDIVRTIDRADIEKSCAKTGHRVAGLLQHAIEERESISVSITYGHDDGKPDDCREIPLPEPTVKVYEVHSENTDQEDEYVDPYQDVDETAPKQITAGRQSNHSQTLHTPSNKNECSETVITKENVHTDSKKPRERKHHSDLRDYNNEHVTNDVIDVGCSIGAEIKETSQACVGNNERDKHDCVSDLAHRSATPDHKCESEHVTTDHPRPRVGSNSDSVTSKTQSTTSIKYVDIELPPTTTRTNSSGDNNRNINASIEPLTTTEILKTDIGTLYHKVNEYEKHLKDLDEKVKLTEKVVSMEKKKTELLKVFRQYDSQLKLSKKENTALERAIESEEYGEEEYSRPPDAIERRAAFRRHGNVFNGGPTKPLHTILEPIDINGPSNIISDRPVEIIDDIRNLAKIRADVVCTEFHLDEEKVADIEPSYKDSAFYTDCSTSTRL